VFFTLSQICLLTFFLLYFSSLYFIFYNYIYTYFLFTCILLHFFSSFASLFISFAFVALYSFVSLSIYPSALHVHHMATLNKEVEGILIKCRYLPPVLKHIFGFTVQLLALCCAKLTPKHCVCNRVQENLGNISRYLGTVKTFLACKNVWDSRNKKTASHSFRISLIPVYASL